MGQDIGKNDYNLGFKITERRCTRYIADLITDLSNSDYIVLIYQ